LSYPLFKGWNKYIYRPEPEEAEDSSEENRKYNEYIDVIAEFETGKASTSAGAQQTTLQKMSIANINANCL
jgi:hypothetical protein